jgi:hypothetical protein
MFASHAFGLKAMVPGGSETKALSSNLPANFYASKPASLIAFWFTQTTL